MTFSTRRLTTFIIVVVVTYVFVDAVSILKKSDENEDNDGFQIDNQYSDLTFSRRYISHSSSTSTNNTLNREAREQNLRSIILSNISGSDNTPSSASFFYSPYDDDHDDDENDYVTSLTFHRWLIAAREYKKSLGLSRKSKSWDAPNERHAIFHRNGEYDYEKNVNSITINNNEETNDEFPRRTREIRYQGTRGLSKPLLIEQRRLQQRQQRWIIQRLRRYRTIEKYGPGNSTKNVERSECLESLVGGEKSPGGYQTTRYGPTIEKSLRRRCGASESYVFDTRRYDEEGNVDRSEDKSGEGEIFEKIIFKNNGIFIDRTGCDDGDNSGNGGGGSSSDGEYDIERDFEQKYLPRVAPKSNHTPSHHNNHHHHHHHRRGKRSTDAADDGSVDVKQGVVTPKNEDDSGNEQLIPSTDENPEMTTATMKTIVTTEAAAAAPLSSTTRRQIISESCKTFYSIVTPTFDIDDYIEKFIVYEKNVVRVKIQNQFVVIVKESSDCDRYVILKNFGSNATEVFNLILEVKLTDDEIVADGNIISDIGSRKFQFNILASNWSRLSDTNLSIIPKPQILICAVYSAFISKVNDSIVDDKRIIAEHEKIVNALRILLKCLRDR